MKNKSLRWLTESAVMIALGTALSMVKVVDFPYGGSVTLMSMLPVMLIAYRYGTLRGLATGAVYGVLQLLLGMSTLSYATSMMSAVAIILLDYVVAFAVLGLAGAFRGISKRQGEPLLLGGLVACLARYICHVVTGCTVWAGVSIPSGDGLIYSLGYNATYMIPETVITLIGLWYLTDLVDLRGESLRAIAQDKKETATPRVILSLILADVLAAVCWDVVLVFSKLQNADTGDFSITGLADVSWTTVGWVTGGAAVIAAALYVVGLLLARKKNK